MNICVYCGSAAGNNPEFTSEAELLGTHLAAHNLGLVYGGASIGLMGTIANAVLQHGGKVTGVIPESLEKREVAHNGLSKLIVTRSMHERKATMASLSDVFVTLPGGFGTLEELFESITWSQLNIHQKPVIILNKGGYYNKLLDFIQHAVHTGFIRHNGRELFIEANSVKQCINTILNSSGKQLSEPFKRSLI